jgi:hypothetical protein
MPREAQEIAQEAAVYLEAQENRPAAVKALLGRAANSPAPGA